MRVAITIPTGRPRVRDVVKTFLDNAQEHGHNLKDFSIYLSIDTQYQNSKVEDFFLHEADVARISKVEYICEQKRKELGHEIANSCDLSSDVVETLFYGNGYSRQRNSAIFLAAKDGNDFAICFDDDEVPFLPLKKVNGDLEWKNPDFFGPHINALGSGTDITRGPCLGYLSPVPSDFEKDIPQEIREKLGDALQWGSDVVTRYSFFDMVNKILYLEKSDLRKNNRPFEVSEGKNGKHIYAGNMGLNLESVRKGKIPIFYTPPEARGEDTIFSLQLRDLVVKEVNSFIFHDPFGMYDEMLQGKFPGFLRSVPITPDTKNRFAMALIGWLKYAPILIAMTSSNAQERENRINSMLNSIGEPTLELADLLNCPMMAQCKDVLTKYNQIVVENVNDLWRLQDIWKNKIISEYFGEKILISN